MLPQLSSSERPVGGLESVGGWQTYDLSRIGRRRRMVYELVVIAAVNYT